MSKQQSKAGSSSRVRSNPRYSVKGSSLALPKGISRQLADYIQQSIEAEVARRFEAEKRLRDAEKTELSDNAIIGRLLPSGGYYADSFFGGGDGLVKIGEISMVIGDEYVGTPPVMSGVNKNKKDEGFRARVEPGDELVTITDLTLKSPILQYAADYVIAEEAPITDEELEELPEPTAIKGGLSETLLSAADVAARFDVDRSTISRKVKAGKILGFKGVKDTIVIPEEQFLNGVVIAGVAETITTFGGNHFAAWQFLSSASFYGDNEDRPIDRLKEAALTHNPQSVVEAVLRRAEADREGAFL